MAIQKYGTRIACTGTVEWKRMVTKTAAQHGISVQFTDRRCNTPCVFYNVWRIRAHTSRKGRQVAHLAYVYALLPIRTERITASFLMT